MKRYKLTFKLLIIILMIFPYPVSATDYRIIPLENDDPADVGAQAMNESGQVAGWIRSTGLGFFWDPTTGLQQISSNGDFCSPVNINDAGLVFGYLGHDKVFLWDNVNGLQSIAEAIFVYDIGGVNNLGQAAGILINDSNETEVFVWDRTSGVQAVGNPGGWIYYLSGINDSGQIAGGTELPNGEWRAFVWDNATGMYILGTLGGSHSYTLQVADPQGSKEWNTGINNSGQVLGVSELENGNWHFFIWDRFNGMKDTGIPFDGDGEATVVGINENGELAGSLNKRAFFWDFNIGMIDLGAPTCLYSEAHDFNNVGQVVGRYCYGIWDCYAFVWDKTNGFQDLSSYTEGSAVALRINDSGQILCQSRTNDSYFLLFPITDQNPTAPVLSEPSNNESGIDPNNVVLQWNPSTDPDGDAIEYCITVKEDSSPEDIPVFTGCDDEVFTSETSFTLPISLEPGKTYCWAVWAKDNQGNWSEASEWWSFTTSGKLYGLFIGTRQHPEGLDYDIGDLRGDLIAAELHEKFRNLGEVESNRLITDSYVHLITQSDVKSEIENLINNPDGTRKIKKGDIFVMYLVGHGSDGGVLGDEPTEGGIVKTAGDEFVHLDYLPLSIGPYMLTDDELKGYLEVIGDDIEKWIFIDACHAGGFWGDEAYPEADEGDLEKLHNICLIAAAEEDKQMKYVKEDNPPSLQNEYGKPLFGIGLREAWSKMEKGYLNCDKDENKVITFQEIELWLKNDFEFHNTNLDGIFVRTGDFGEESIFSWSSWEPVAHKSPDFVGVISGNSIEYPFANAGGPYLGDVGLPISFDASGSTSPNESIISYEWDWDNDGFFDEISYSPSITYTWVEPYSGTIRLRITDNEGLSEIDSASVDVIDPNDIDDDEDGYTENQGDCDDESNNTYPGAIEIPYDGIDQDCDGNDLTDIDGDGYDSIEVGGDDCDDNNADVNPGAIDVCNGIDDNCDGRVDEETIPPEISLSIMPDTLWPPNHKMVLVTPTTTVNDNCDPSPAIGLQSITMNEGELSNTYDPNYDSTVGDGHTIDDIQVDEDGTIYLRAERSGTGSGRIYTITYTATDSSGNSSSASATVTVPHNQ